MNFNEKKAAQVAAFLINREGGQMEILKLMKLMYLAERESYINYGEPLTGDELCSMEHGPVMSITLNHCNNLIDSNPGGWTSWIKDREDNLLSLRNNEDPTDRLLELSDADLEILERIWEKFGNMTGSQLRKFTHDNCPEWEDPHQSSKPIPYSRLLKCIGYDDETVKELESRLYEQRYIDDRFKVREA